MERINIINVLKHVVVLLVNKNYDRLFLDDYLKEGEYEFLWKNIKDYGGQITMPTEEALVEFDIYEKSDNSVGVDFNLWVDDKESDLTLQLDIIEKGEDYYYTIVDIHIL